MIAERLAAPIFLGKEEIESAFAIVKRLFQEVDDARFILRSEGEAIDDDLERFLRNRRFFDFVELTNRLLHQQAMEARLTQAVANFVPSHRRSRQGKRQDHRRAFGQCSELTKHRLRRVTFDDALAAVAIEHGDLGEQQLEMVVELGHGADRGTRGAHGPALIDGDGRWDALDAFDVGLVHTVEKLARVGGKTLDIAALAFSVEDVECQGRFTRAADAGDDGERVEWNLDVEVLEIVLLGAADADRFSVHDPTLLQAIFLGEDAAKARTVNQIKGFFFIGKELQRGVLGVVDDVLGLFQREVDLPKQRRGNIHRPPQPAQLFLFIQQRFFVRRHRCLAFKLPMEGYNSSCANLLPLPQAVDESSFQSAAWHYSHAESRWKPSGSKAMGLWLVAAYELSF